MNWLPYFEPKSFHFCVFILRNSLCSKYKQFRTPVFPISKNFGTSIRSHDFGSKSPFSAKLYNWLWSTHILWKYQFFVKSKRLSKLVTLNWELFYIFLTFTVDICKEMINILRTLSSSFETVQKHSFLSFFPKIIIHFCLFTHMVHLKPCVSELVLTR